MNASARYISTCRKTGFILLFACLLPKNAAAQSAETWVDSRPYLVESQKPQSPQGFPLLKSIYSVMAKSLSNPEQHRQLADIQNRLGSKAQDARLHSLSIHQNSALKATVAPVDVSRSMSTFLGRELKTTAMPDTMQKGFAFNLGVNSSSNDTKTPTSVRYGLIVTNLEPSPEPFRLASLSRNSNDEYALVPYAPKARVQYEVGRLPDEQDPARTHFEQTKTGITSLISQLPDFQFRGKIVSRGVPTANQILPPQALTLEQSQGYYAMEVQTSQLIHKDALFHRIRVPLIGNMNLREERNDKMKKTRSTLENIYSKGPMALNLDYFGAEKRYQTGLIFQQALTRIELYNHLPQNASPQARLWNQQRWELKLQTAF